MYGSAGDVTRKPKPINPTENTLYSPMPMFPYSSPKNPIGVVPYQPKSKYCFYIFLNNLTILSVLCFTYKNG